MYFRVIYGTHTNFHLNETLFSFMFRDTPLRTETKERSTRGCDIELLMIRLVYRSKISTSITLGVFNLQSMTVSILNFLEYLLTIRLYDYEYSFLVE